MAQVCDCAAVKRGSAAAGIGPSFSVVLCREMTIPFHRRTGPTLNEHFFSFFSFFSCCVLLWCRLL